ncbi:MULTISPECIES: DUF4190 domain-containing protein [Actinomyces]|uniref:DUF4190 domain-containing protein n=1 Tax=Actinomyces TaxID=1654 RepID=UPI0010A22437|nr:MULTISPECIES: DUF4190 domain-containing protein [Actinomyces]
MTSYDPNQNPGNNQGYPGGQPPQYQGGPNGQAPQYQGYNQPAGYGMNPTAMATEKNSLGGWALGLGIASVCCGIFTGIPAIILGYLGMQAANEGRANNKGMAIAGIVLGVLSIVWSIINISTGMVNNVLNN